MHGFKESIPERTVEALLAVQQGPKQKKRITCQNRMTKLDYTTNCH